MSAHWTGPHKPLAGGRGTGSKPREAWRLITFNAAVELTVTFEPKGEEFYEDVFFWLAEINGEEIDGGSAEDLPDAQQAAMDAMEGYAVRLVDAVRSLTLTIQTPEDR